MSKSNDAASRRPFVVAHRGASFDANENCALAIERARNLGVAFIEVDVRLAADGAVVLAHDEDLLRGAGDPRRVADLDLAELRRIGVRYRPEFPSEPLLSLDEALDAAGGIPLAIELKGGAEGRSNPDAAALSRLAAAVCDALSGRGDRTSVVISFEALAAEAAAARIGADRCGLVRNAEYGADGWKDLLATQCRIAVLSRKIVTRPIAAAVLAAGREPWCYALDDAASVTSHVALGIRGIISNRPDVALGALEG
jgi:glycerophosphoryl diester phosphodiesterase